MENGVSYTLEQLLDWARDLGASDVHLTAFHPPYFRKTGRLGRAKNKDDGTPKFRDLTPEDLKKLVYSRLNDRQRTRLDNLEEVDLSIKTERGTYRVNVSWQKGTIAGVARVVPDRIIPVEEIGFPTEIYQDIPILEKGLIFVTGPTGCGKSTTLAAILKRINETDDCKIISIEDPQEYEHESLRSLIWQKEVGRDTNSFPAAAKYAMRQDPDVILVGEVRDSETLLAALSLAYSGHIVFTTLHTGDAVSTIGRCIDFFPPEKKGDIARQLADNLEVVISQKLLVGKDNRRYAAMDILRATPAVVNNIAQWPEKPQSGAAIKSAMQTGLKEKMMPMDVHIYKLLTDEKIDQMNAIRAAIDKRSMGVKIDAYTMKQYRDGRIDRETAMRLAIDREAMTKNLDYKELG